MSAANGNAMRNATPASAPASGPMPRTSWPYMANRSDRGTSTPRLSSARRTKWLDRNADPTAVTATAMTKPTI